MRLLIFIALVLFSSQIKSQSQRFFYELKYVSDSTKIDSVSTELMQLDIFKNHSEFLSAQQAVRDSAIFNVKQKSNEVGSNLKEGTVRLKTYKGLEKYSYESVGVEQFKIVYKEKLNWTLTNERKEIGKYNCQKATINFNGRSWTAWFTTEIPIQDGPYLFDNLPGLILSVEDSKKKFSFNYVGNIKIKNSSPNISFTKRIEYPTITREQFNKKWKIFRQNPIGWREQWVINNPNIQSSKYYDANGLLLNKDKVYKGDREKIKLKLARENTYIDKDLYR